MWKSGAEKKLGRERAWSQVRRNRLEWKSEARGRAAQHRVGWVARGDIEWGGVGGERRQKVRWEARLDIVSGGCTDATQGGVGGAMQHRLAGRDIEWGGWHGV